MLKVDAILETAIHVADPSASAAFYRRLFGLEVLLESERLVALNVGGRSVLLLFRRGATGEAVNTPGGRIPGHAGAGQGHFAFGIEESDFEPWYASLQSAGIEVESVVDWPGGGRSLYLRDPDDHLVELITPGFWKLG